MTVVTKVLPKLYKYLNVKKLPASVADAGGKMLKPKGTLSYVKPSAKSSDELSQSIQQAYRSYSVSPYVNEYLRNKAPMSASANDVYLGLKAGIAKSQGVAGEFIRGIAPKRNLPITPDTISKYVFFNKGFTSTAPMSKADYANCFTSMNGALVKFEIKKPMKAFQASNGYEVIFDTNAFTPDKFKIIQEADKNVYRVIQL